MTTVSSGLTTAMQRDSMPLLVGHLLEKAHLGGSSCPQLSGNIGYEMPAGFNKSII